MMKFTYRWGERPLDGYTLKRGLGQGGFGEVYFALSDGGKEVALKLIRGHSDTELRGIANCLNLKHPNLVHLYDLRVDSQGDRWLVMEYIQGEPLSALLQRSPRGLPEEQVRLWFTQAAQAVAYLHDHAVVHRDIKPGNLFIENGLAKLGDYGLSKAVGTSQHAQSSNVGTIHYMAPEVASGTYSKQIDIYACGVLLYEMLTGEVPFKGESWVEIALKHQTDLPDLSKVPARYAPILEKAMNKKAERRFTDVGAMIEALEALDQPPGRVVEPSPRPPTSPAPKPILQTPSNSAAQRSRASELSRACLLAPFFAAPIVGVWALMAGSVHWGALGAQFLETVAMSWCVLLATKVWEGQKTSLPRRVALGVFGAAIGVAACWLDGWALPELWMRDEALPAGLQAYWGGALRCEQGGFDMLCGFVLFYTLALVAPRWWLSAQRKRSERFSLYPLIANGLWALLLYGIWRSQMEQWDHVAPPGYVVMVVAGAAAVVQLASPFSPPPPPQLRFRRRLDDRNR